MMMTMRPAEAILDPAKAVPERYNLCLQPWPARQTGGEFTQRTPPPFGSAAQSPSGTPPSPPLRAPPLPSQCFLLGKASRCPRRQVQLPHARPNVVSPVLGLVVGANFAASSCFVAGRPSFVVRGKIWLRSPPVPNLVLNFAQRVPRWAGHSVCRGRGVWPSIARSSFSLSLSLACSLGWSIDSVTHVSRSSSSLKMYPHPLLFFNRKRALLFYSSTLLDTYLTGCCCYFLSLMIKLGCLPHPSRQRTSFCPLDNHHFVQHQRRAQRPRIVLCPSTASPV